VSLEKAKVFVDEHPGAKIEINGKKY
jgi:hypothetical protein